MREIIYVEQIHVFVFTAQNWKQDRFLGINYYYHYYYDYLVWVEINTLYENDF